MSNGAETRVQRSRRHILQAALKVFLRQGYIGTSMDSVAESAAVSKQTLYAHFGSKERLFVAMVEAATGEAAASLKAEVADPELNEQQPVAVFLRAFARAQLRIVLTPTLMELRRLVIGEVDRFPELGQALYAQGPGRSIERLSQAIQHYCASGELVVADSRAAASFFNWLLMGEPTNNVMLLGNAALPTEEWLQQHGREAVRIFLSAYQSQAAAH